MGIMGVSSAATVSGLRVSVSAYSSPAISNFRSSGSATTAASGTFSSGVSGTQTISGPQKQTSHIFFRPSKYQKRYDALVDRFDTAKARQKVLAQQITDLQARRQQIELFLTGLKKREPLTVFRDEDWLAMVDYVTVTEDAGGTVTFKDGTKIDV